MLEEDQKEIFTRLGNLEKEMEIIKTTVTGMAVSGEKVVASLERMNDGLLGTLDKPGVMIRLDRLEQSEQKRNRLIWIIATAVVGLAIEVAWGLIAK